MGSDSTLLQYSGFHLDAGRRNTAFHCVGKGVPDQQEIRHVSPDWMGSARYSNSICKLDTLVLRYI